MRMVLCAKHSDHKNSSQLIIVYKQGDYNWRIFLLISAIKIGAASTRANLRFYSLLSFPLYGLSCDTFAYAIIIGAIAYINKEREGVEICYATAERPFCRRYLSLGVYFS